MRGRRRRAAPTFATPEEAVTALIDVVKAGRSTSCWRSSARTGRSWSTRRIRRPPAETARCSPSPSPKGGDWSIKGPTPRCSSSATRNGHSRSRWYETANGWRFDTAAGKEEVIARRIGRNELAAMQICRTYVAAQRLYARRATMESPRACTRRRSAAIPGSRTACIGRPGEVRSAARWETSWRRRRQEGRPLGADRQPSPFHGYYFKILTGSGRRRDRRSEELRGGR